MITERFDFYGTERYDRAGKHPGEFMAENVDFDGADFEDCYSQAIDYAAGLATNWRMPVRVEDADSGETYTTVDPA